MVVMSRGETVNLPDRENRSDSDPKLRGYLGLKGAKLVVADCW